MTSTTKHAQGAEVQEVLSIELNTNTSGDSVDWNEESSRAAKHLPVAEQAHFHSVGIDSEVTQTFEMGSIKAVVNFQVAHCKRAFEAQFNPGITLLVNKNNLAHRKQTKHEDKKHWPPGSWCA